MRVLAAIILTAGLLTLIIGMKKYLFGSIHRGEQRAKGGEEV